MVKNNGDPIRIPDLSPRCPYLWYISLNWFSTRAPFSCDIARWTSGSTTSPTATEGLPQALAITFLNVGHSHITYSFGCFNPIIQPISPLEPSALPWYSQADSESPRMSRQTRWRCVNARGGLREFGGEIEDLDITNLRFRNVRDRLPVLDLFAH